MRLGVGSLKLWDPEPGPVGPRNNLTDPSNPEGRDLLSLLPDGTPGGLPRVTVETLPGGTHFFTLLKVGVARDALFETAV